MKAYWAILKARLSTLFQYRAAALAGLGTQIFWGLIKTMLLTAFFAQSSATQPLSLEQAITFIWLGQTLLQLLPWKIDKELEAQVRNGNVAYELIRPLDLYGLWFARSLALCLVPTVLRCIPLALLASLFFGLANPVSGAAAYAFLASLCLSATLSAAITTLVLISLFWTISGEGILRLLPHTVILFSGMVVPLPLFPDWMQPFLSTQPFRCIIDIPCRLYTGVIPSDQAWFYLGFQLLWIFLCVMLGKHLMHSALRRLVIQGG